MGAGPGQYEGICFLGPDQQPVRFEVTFPGTRPVAGQPMGPVTGFERLFRQESLDDRPEFMKILAPLFGAVEVSFKTPRGEQTHCSFVFGLELVKVRIFGQALSIVCFSQRLTGLSVGNLHRKRKAAL